MRPVRPADRRRGRAARRPRPGGVPRRVRADRRPRPLRLLRRHRRPQLRPLPLPPRPGRASACPTSRYYRDEKFAEVREKYVAYLATLLRPGGPRRPRRRGARRVLEHRHPARRRALGAGRDPRRAEDLQPAHRRRAARAVPGLRLGRLRPQPQRVGDRGRRAARRVLRAPAVVLLAPLHGPRRGADRGLAGLAAQPRAALGRAVPPRRRSSRPTSTSTAAPSTAPPSCARAGSAASRWSRARWARRWARSTSPGTSRRRPRR